MILARGWNAQGFPAIDVRNLISDLPSDDDDVRWKGGPGARETRAMGGGRNPRRSVPQHARQAALPEYLFILSSSSLRQPLNG